MRSGSNKASSTSRRPPPTHHEPVATYSRATTSRSLQVPRTQDTGRSGFSVPGRPPLHPVRNPMISYGPGASTSSAGPTSGFFTPPINYGTGMSGWTFSPGPVAPPTTMAYQYATTTSMRHGTPPPTMPKSAATEDRQAPLTKVYTVDEAVEAAETMRKELLEKYSEPSSVTKMSLDQCNREILARVRLMNELLRQMLPLWAASLQSGYWPEGTGLVLLFNSLRKVCTKLEWMITERCKGGRPLSEARVRALLGISKDIGDIKKLIDSVVDSRERR
ncbi:hypothetical protein QBC41DRAFT_327198 [Cercophora samala]|uniref:Uncharacterized protein n=1 Tax=Cercophora samala TaxID=330535 RepID=A0AA39Z7V0_9PEZI|nr:hypothetical protein QBC41DRAFT_327198 [Cercophora samala]